MNFFEYSPCDYVFDQARVHECFNCSLGVKYTFYSVYRMIHFKKIFTKFFVEANSDKYKSNTEGDKHIV